MLTIDVVKTPSENINGRGTRLIITGMESQSVGRGDADFRLHDSNLSRKHLQFMPTEKGWMVRDLHSTNGTVIRNQQAGISRPVTGRMSSALWKASLSGIGSA